MNDTLLRASLAFLPVCALIYAFALSFLRRRNAHSLMRLFGAVCLLIVVLTHVFEALALLPAMGWGREHSLGHYVDLTSAILALTFVPAGLLIRPSK